MVIDSLCCAPLLVSSPHELEGVQLLEGSPSLFEFFVVVVRGMCSITPFKM